MTMRSALAGALALATMWPVAAGATTAVQADAPVTGNVVIEPTGSPADVNPTGRAVVLTAPVMDGQVYMGDATLTLDAAGRGTFAAARLLALLEPRLRPELVTRLRAALATRGELGRRDLEGVGISLGYDPQSLQINLDIASASRGAQTVEIGSDGDRPYVSYIAPAELSAYLNVRGSLDWVQQGLDEGVQSPIFFIDGATRIGDVVFESEVNWQPGILGTDFQRRGSRFVHDDRARLVRWTAGDLQTLARGFQSAPDIAGLSVSRLYSILDPQTIIRPRGSRAFRLERRSLVEVRINNQLVRRLELDPGSYDLRDFPFTQGANDVRLTITDDAGRTESFDFNIFLDQAQLAEGMSEFGLYAGVLAPPGASGPVYSDTPAFSGFYRRGINDRLTLGGNFQIDTHGWMAGAEGVIATPIGAFAGFASASQVDGYGRGWAGIATFQRTISRSENRADTLSLSLEARSRDFAPIGVRVPFNPYSLVAGAGYTTAFSDAVYAGFDARYSIGRDAERDVVSVRGSLGWRISPDLSFTGDATWEQDGAGRRFGVFLSLTYRVSQRSTVRADYDSRFNRGRLSYQTFDGTGVGSYTLNADVERSDIGAGATVNAIYYGNRAELGFSHYGTFERDLGASTGQRSSLRFGTSIAMADGVFSVGRPIQDSFALVAAHRSLRETSLLVDPSGGSAQASTRGLGTALQPGLASYSERTLLVTAPDAPLGTDLGEGAFRLRPPYRAGYLLRVGSDYNVSVVGRLLGRDGAPIRLVAGTASEAAHPEREPVALFTNSEGRFGATGLAPGRWRITLTDAERTSFEIEIADGQEGTLSVGELRPAVP